MFRIFINFDRRRLQFDARVSLNTPVIILLFVPLLDILKNGCICIQEAATGKPRVESQLPWRIVREGFAPRVRRQHAFLLRGPVSRHLEIETKLNDKNKVVWCSFQHVPLARHLDSFTILRSQKGC